MQTEQKLQSGYTDREIWEFGTKCGFPEDPELSLFAGSAYEFFSDRIDLVEAEAKREEDRLAAIAAAELEKLALQKLAEADMLQESETPAEADETEKPEEPEKATEPQKTEALPEELIPEESNAEESKIIEEEAKIIEEVRVEAPGKIETELLQDPAFESIIRHAVASAMYPQNVFRLYADISGEELRLRGAQPIQGGPDTAFGVFVNVGNAGSLISAESPENIRALVAELASVTSEEPPVSMPVSPLAQIAMLAACDVILEKRFEGDRFTPSALLNTLSLAEDHDFRRLCAPVAWVIGARLLAFISLEEMIQVMEELANLGIFIREKAGERILYSFASAYRPLPELFAGGTTRFALCRYDIEGEGDLLYIVSEGTLSWAFIIEDKAGRIEKIDKEGLVRVLREIFPVSLFCTNCGAPLPPGGKFCDQCGARAV